MNRSGVWRQCTTTVKTTMSILALGCLMQPLAWPQTPAATPQRPGIGAERREEMRRAEQERLRTDWANLARYREENAQLGRPAPGETRVVFMGDSITAGWARGFDEFFPGKPYVGRGISGQTTPQMLVRFQQDVVALKPKVVVINAGTNDIAGNTGPSTVEMIQDNVKSMTQIARANGIKVVLASITPAYDYPWRPGLEPVRKLLPMNAWMKNYCAETGCVYADYFTPMADEKNGMKEGLSGDGIHPNKAGHAIMAPIAEAAIAKALAQ